MRTEITSQSLPGGYTGISATLTLAAVDHANGNNFKMSGNDMIVARNPTGGALTISLTSVADGSGRVADFTESVPAAGLKVYGPFRYIGWRDDNGFMSVDGDSGLELAVIKL